MDARLDETDDDLAQALRGHRPSALDAASLEQRLAVGAILAASGAGGVPQRIGRLEVQSRIGGGGMGIVYRAWDPVLHRLVALKVLRERAATTGADARTEDEARALARLSHPHVVPIYDVIREGDELCLVMEYVSGRTLEAWLAQHPGASWREAVAWFVQAGHGVSAAHAAGIVHQDLKPANVLIGDDGRARVVDFGLSRGTHLAAAEGGLAGGTPRYMAPEIGAGAVATPQSDQFSLCVALRDALEGKDAPASVRDAIARGLAPDPGARHESVAALVALLEAALHEGGEDRARRLLLERVERLWLRGVLDRSLEGGAIVDLALRAAPALVEPPWERWGVGASASSTHARELQRVLRESHGSLLIVGPPGSGKTTSLLLLCRDLWRTASLQRDEPVPVVLSLSTYEPEPRSGPSLSAHFAAWVVDELVAKYGLPRPAVRRGLDEAGFVLLLDGLDETAAALRERVVETLNAFRAEHPVSIVVNCRDTEYQALTRKLTFGGALELLPLDDEGVARVLEARHAGERLTHLVREGHLRDELHAQMRNPLLLTLFANGAEIDEQTQTPRWDAAYRRYVEQAFKGVEPGARAALQRQLSYLARVMRAHNVSDLWLERLHFGWLEGRVERAAAYISAVLLVVAFGVGLNLAQAPLTGNSVESSLIFGIGVSVSSFAYTRGRIKPVESLRWSWRRMLRLLPITTVCATLVGLAEAMRMNFWANLVGAGITGALLAVAFALDIGDRAGKVRPNAGIHRSLAIALATSFGLGVPAGLFFGLIVHPFIRRPLIATPEGEGNHELMVGVSVGLFVFTALFLIYGGFTVLVHYVLRVWLAWRTPLPLSLQPALDRAVALGLMRRVGGGWVFLHRTLQDYFADADAKR